MNINEIKREEIRALVRTKSKMNIPHLDIMGTDGRFRFKFHFILPNIVLSQLSIPIFLLLNFSAKYSLVIVFY